MDDSGRAPIMELAHDPWPGFRRAFYIVFTAACIYLAVVLLATLPDLPRLP